MKKLRQGEANRFAQLHTVSERWSQDFNLAVSSVNALNLSHLDISKYGTNPAHD